jgi:hypothetical protein
LHGVWAGRVVACLWVLVYGILILSGGGNWGLLSALIAMAIAFAVVNELVYRWWGSYRRRTFEDGEGTTAKLLRRRIAMRGGYTIVDVEYELRGVRRRSTGRIGVRTSIQFSDGDFMPIRVRSIRFLGTTLWQAWIAVPTLRD